jgi:CrcB protein
VTALKEIIGPIASAMHALLTNKVVILAVGGALGTNARYWLARWSSELTWQGAFPLGTFVINVTGSLILGFVGVVFLERLTPEHRDWYLLLGTGFCGGYTTFSTFEWETFNLIRDRSWMLAAANVVGSVAVGLGGVVLGVTLAGLLFPESPVPK